MILPMIRTKAAATKPILESYRCGICGREYTLDRRVRGARKDRPCHSCAREHSIAAPKYWRPNED